jgi:iron complex transport system ATP-binding protein
VLIAMALAQQGRLLMLDEPTVHLDLRHQVEIMQLLVDLNEREGLTIIAVLHDLALAAAMFPRIVLVADGRIAADGAAASVLTPERIREVYGVDPRFLPTLMAPVGASRSGDPDR